MIRRHGLTAAALSASLLFVISAHAQTAATPPSPQTTVDSISRDIEQIRGLTFRNPVGVAQQTAEGFMEYLSRRMAEQVPDRVRRHYGKIVSTLGIYRGPPIEDFEGMMKAALSSQVGAYYDPEKRSFFVLLQDMNESMQGVVYSHELYHALQDQYFNIADYTELKGKYGTHPANADIKTARGAVVEGEATYMMTLWSMQKATGNPPTREMLVNVVAMQEKMGAEHARASAQGIPSFIMETILSTYFKGMSFVFAVHEQGWPAVEKLYNEYPPESTEQILHPEKWLAREAPVRFDWPKFAKVSALRDWELLDDDVLGELNWRLVFKEQGFTGEVESVATGWGGDRYAVFKRKDSDATLLLMRTSWDSEQDAKEFADTYRRVQAGKYGTARVPMRLEQHGVDVFIVEGGDESSADSLLKLVKKVRRSRH